MVYLRKTLVVVGHGMVGHRFVQAAIERGLTETPTTSSSWARSSGRPTTALR